MHLDERSWKIIPPSLEGAGWFEARQRAEVEIRKLLLEIKGLQAENDRLRARATELDRQIRTGAQPHQETSFDLPQDPFDPPVHFRKS